MPRGAQLLLAFVYACLLSVMPLAHSLNAPMLGPDAPASTGKETGTATHCGQHGKTGEHDDATAPESNHKGTDSGCKTCQFSNCGAVMEARLPAGTLVHLPPLYFAPLDPTLADSPPQRLTEPPRV